jgi:hypothetical protein
LFGDDLRSVPILDPNETDSASKLEHGVADSRGPFGLGQLSRLLTRRQGGAVRLRQQDGQALRRYDGSGAVDAPEPLELGHLSRLLTRRQAGGARLTRRYGQALGRCDGSGAADA